MPIIRATQKLQKELGLKSKELPSIPEQNAAFSEWYAHIFFINRKKYIIFVEAQTLFSFTLQQVKKKDLQKSFQDLFETSLAKALFVEGVSSEIMDKVMACVRKEYVHTKTCNRRVIGSMNEFIKEMKASYFYNGELPDVSERLCLFTPSTGFAAGSKEMKYPVEVFAEKAREMWGLDFEPNKKKYFEDAMEQALDGAEDSFDVFPQTPRDRAEELVWEAYQAEYVHEAIDMANEALAIYRDCASAYILLAQEGVESLEEKRDLYEKAVLAGEQDLGKKFIHENRGHLWMMHEARSYMSALKGLAQTVWDLGEQQKAIDYCYEMLSLNIGDNQGIRYVLIQYLAWLGRYIELETFMTGEQYQNDIMPDWLYTKVLLQFVKTGESAEARNFLLVALDQNKCVPEYLCGRKRIPRKIPERFALGSKEEAMSYAEAFIDAWKKVDGLLAWLDQATAADSSKRR